MKILSVCMIVKNGEEFLPKTLAPLVAGADEVILVDTGSTDNTVQIARELGAKVVEFPWINDFSAARNESIRHAQGKWILWVDADEFIKKEDIDKIRNILLVLPSIKSMSLRINECSAVDTESIQGFYYRDKVFINEPGVKFERPINEQLVIPENVEGEVMLLNEVSIYHWGGSLSHDKIEEKTHQRIEMYKQFIETHPEDVATRCMLARKYKLLNLQAEEIAEYNQIIEITGNEGPFAAEAHLRKAWIFYLKEDFQSALAEISEVKTIDELNAEAICLEGQIYLKLSDYEEAIETFDEIDLLSPAKSVQLYTDYKFYYYFPFLYRAMLYMVLGKPQEALKYFTEVLERYPNDPTVTRLLDQLGGLK